MKRLPDPLPCPDARERLPLYVGGDLETDAQEAVRGHLQSCAACRGEEARAREAREHFVAALDGSLATLPRVGLWPTLRHQLREEGLLPSLAPAAEPVPAPRKGLRPLKRWAPLMAAAAAVALVLVVVDPFGRSTPGVPGVIGPTATPANGVPVVPVATGGLRRVAPDEDALLQRAEPLRRGLELGPVGPRQLSEPALVNYR